MEHSGIYFNYEEKSFLLELARKSIDDFLRVGKVCEIDEEELSPAMIEPMGAFVSLHKDGELRGCVGRFSPDEPLYQVVQEMSVAAAVEDHRFPNVELTELEDIKIEISALTPLKKINDVSEIELGKHGIYIRKGSCGGTFLPQVASHTGWSLDEFLGHCARDKAGIGWEGWKDADIYVYEAIVFEE